MRKKILIIACNTLDRGGVQSIIMSIVRNLSSVYQFDIVVFDSQERLYDKEFLSYGGEIIRLPNYEGKSQILKRFHAYGRGFFRIGRIRRIIRAHGPYEAIHCHNDFESGVFLYCAKKENVPVRVSHAHIAKTWVHLSKRILNQAYSRLIRKYSTDRICCSESAGDYIFKGMAYKIINNTYNEKLFDYNNQVQHKDPNVLSILQIGYYCYNKNQQFTIEVFDAICKRYANSKLVFVGFEGEEPGYSNQMNIMIKDRQLSGKVCFYPADANIPRLLSDSSYLVFPSHAEGFGIVLIEAQSMGVKCFVSDTVPNTTNCGGCTFLSLEEGAEKWADRIVESFLCDKGTHIPYDCDKYKEQNVMTEYERIYRGERL